MRHNNGGKAATRTGSWARVLRFAGSWSLLGLCRALALIEPDAASLQVAAKVGQAATGRGRLEAAERIVLRRRRPPAPGAQP